MRNLMCIFFLSLFIFHDLCGQSLIDAIRYSQIQPSGTARTAAVAGSFGSMGGDWGSSTINPAGMGDFHKSEFNLGLSINRTDTDAIMNGDQSSLISDSNSSPNINHLGLVFAGKPNSNWVTSNFAIGLSQTKNLTEEWTYNGNTIGSITERFAERANGRTSDQLDDFEAGLAWDVQAIYDLNGDLSYETDFFDTTSMITKGQIIDRRGKINELNLTWAGNYDRRFNVGVSLHFPFGSFEEIKEYAEIDGDGSLPYFDYLQYNESLSTSAFGFNMKVGATARLGKTFRAGLAVHTPSWLRMEDDYEATLNYIWTDDDGTRSNLTSESPFGTFIYKLKTPWKFILSGGALFNFENVKAFINADVEWINYSQTAFNFTRFSDSGDDARYQDEINEEIDSELGGAINARIGAELAYKKLRIRAGVNGEGSPYDIDGSSFDRTTIAGGVGLRFDKIFIDIAAFRFSDNEGYIPYVVLDSNRNNLIEKDQKITKIMVSFGFKF